MIMVKMHDNDMSKNVIMHEHGWNGNYACRGKTVIMHEGKIGMMHEHENCIDAWHGIKW